MTKEEKLHALRLQIQVKNDDDCEVLLDNDTIIVEVSCYGGEDACWDTKCEYHDDLVKEFPELEVSESYTHRHKYAIINLKLKEDWDSVSKPVGQIIKETPIYSYYESHQDDNDLVDEGEYVKVEDFKKALEKLSSKITQK